MLKGNLKLLVLKLLEKEEKSGYVLMKELGEILDKKPSAGSMYPLLDDLSKNKLVVSRKDGKSIRYSLTKEGKKSLSQLTKQKKEIIEQIKSGFDILITLSDEPENLAEDFKLIFKQISAKLKKLDK